MEQQHQKRDEKKKESLLDKEEEKLDKEFLKQKKRERFLKNQSDNKLRANMRIEKLSERIEAKLANNRFVLLKHASNRSSSQVDLTV